jgi:formylglycine-generating enzyme required for sulfatase activity
VGVSDDRALWDSVKDSRDVNDLNAYLRKFPQGLFSEVAMNRIKSMSQGGIQVAMPSVPVSVSSSPPLVGGSFKDCQDCPEMLPIPPGSFDMGSNEDGDSRPVHRVTVQGFFMGKTEVTLEQWKAVMGRTPRYPSKCLENCPIAVSWDDALLFTKQLSEKTGKQYRLPSEAEWEYAARASSRTKWSFGDNENSIQDYAWFRSNNNKMESPVALKKPNLFGLFDMHGNLWEWTQDCWNNNYTGAPTDGSVWATGDCSRRVVRGGSWQSSKSDLRSAYRNTFTSTSSVTNGFRVVRTNNVILPAPISGLQNNPPNSYAQMIRMSIKPHILFTEEVAGNPKATVVILVNEQGQIYSRDLIEKSGLDSWDQAVLKAIDRTKVIPKDTNGKVPPKLEISFRPKF